MARTGRTFPIRAHTNYKGMIGVYFNKSFLVSDTIASSENVTALRVRLLSAVDTIVSSESVVALRGQIFSVADTIVTSESVRTLRAMIFTVIDTIISSEVITVAKKWFNLSKNNSTATNMTKNSSTWNNLTKQ